MSNKNSDTKSIEVFRPGTFTSMGGQSFTASNPVPVVIGHPKTDDPAFGWVQSFSYDQNNERLVANIGELEPQFADQVTSGKFKRISMSFFAPGSTANPAGDALYPKHIGFLGAKAPAVPGLKPVSFSDDAECLTFEFADPAFKDVARLFRKIREFFIDEYGVEKADDVLSDWQINWIDDAGNEPEAKSFSEHNEDQSMSNTNDNNDARETELTTREQQLAAREAKLRNQEHVSFADGLINEGKLPSGHKDQLVALLDGIGAEANAEISFGEPGQEQTKNLVDLTKELFSGLPKIVEFGEQDIGDDNDTPKDDVRDIAQAARAYQFAQSEKGITVSTSDAVDHVRKERGLTD